MTAVDASASVLKGTVQPRWFGAVGAVAVLVGLVGLFAGIDALRARRPDVTVGAVGIGSFVLLMAATAIAGKLLARELQVDADGIETRTRSGKVTRIRWSEAHDFYYRAIVGAGLAQAVVPPVAKASVRAPDGRRIDVDDVRVPGNPNAGVPGLVEQYSTRATWPRILAGLQAGEDVAFGPVRMNRQRLQIGLLSYPLDRTLQVGVEKGQIQVQAEGCWLSSKVWVRDVANYPCLLRAIAELAPKGAR